MFHQNCPKKGEGLKPYGNITILQKAALITSHPLLGSQAVLRLLSTKKKSELDVFGFAWICVFSFNPNGPDLLESLKIPGGGRRGQMALPLTLLPIIRMLKLMSHYIVNFKKLNIYCDVWCDSAGCNQALMARKKKIKSLYQI